MRVTRLCIIDTHAVTQLLLSLLHKNTNKTMNESGGGSNSVKSGMATPNKDTPTTSASVTDRDTPTTGAPMTDGDTSTTGASVTDRDTPTTGVTVTLLIDDPPTPPAELTDINQEDIIQSDDKPQQQNCGK